MENRNKGHIKKMFFLFPGSNVATMIDEMEFHGCNIAAKTVDLDEVDKESIHLLVFLFTQFLSCGDQVYESSYESCVVTT